MIIAFTGKKGSGKSLACQILKDKGYEELNFADPLKHMAVELVPSIPLADCYDLEAKERAREIVLSVPKVVRLLNKYNITQMPTAFLDDARNAYIFPSLRKFLQWIGTEAFRTSNKDFWVDILVAQVQPDKNYVVGDCRFSNEVDAIKRLGGSSVMINRPSVASNTDTHASEQFDFTTDYAVTNTELDLFKRDVVAIEGLVKHGQIKGQE